MREIPREEVLRRITADNGWWAAPHRIPQPDGRLTPRAYLDQFTALAFDAPVRRAVLLMGPRRVGKTVLIRHAVRVLLDRGVRPERILYVSVDHPLFNGLGLADFLAAWEEATGLSLEDGEAFVFFDEIQYLRDWERHLKALVDQHPSVRFVASGSAAAALKLKSQESGAGRFTDFLLPPLTFSEYLSLTEPERRAPDPTADTEALNRRFVSYVNFGGYPEVALSPEIQADPGRFVKADIIDKVLLRDLPTLYGIEDVQELNALFTTLAFNSANEVSLEALSKKSGVAKNTLKRYIEYLEAAFLLKVVHRVDRNARRFQRATAFKVYLTNPSMRAALFAPVSADDPATGDLVETAVFAQWFHARTPIHYARWDREGGEVDLVGIDAAQRPTWVTEVKWTDRPLTDPSEIAAAVLFARQHDLGEIVVTTRTARTTLRVDGVEVRLVPAALYALWVGAESVAQPAGDVARRVLARFAEDTSTA